MQFFPWDSHCFPGFEVCDSAGYFFIPSFLDRLIGCLETVEQGVGKRRPLINGQGQSTF